MHIILGATGHVGSAVVHALLAAGEDVIAVVHDAAHATSLARDGAEIAVGDIHDSDALREVLRLGRRAFLLNPPADVSTDTEIEEHRTADAIVRALDGSGLEKVVAASTYGAQPGERCGDLNILYDFEQALARQPIPATIQRASYYMSNWDALLPAARQGTLPTMIPADMALPMVAPEDLGRAAAEKLREPIERTGLRHVEGPELYSPRDVAQAFARALGRPVEPQEIPPAEWEGAYRKLGFSEAAAHSYARMTAASVDIGFAVDAAVERGPTTLQAYIDALVARRPA